jgi:hypothetical protein
MVVFVEYGSADRDALVTNIEARDLPALLFPEKRRI